MRKNRINNFEGIMKNVKDKWQKLNMFMLREKESERENEWNE